MKVLRILYGMLRMARRPMDYARIEKFRELLRRYGYFDSGVRRMNGTAPTQGIMAAKPLLDWDTDDLNRLRSLPAASLGHQIAAFLDRNGLGVLSYESDPSLTDVEYFLRRVLQTHDIWHVVLGYETDILGELGINAFMLAQIDWPSGGFYISGYLLRTMLRHPLEAPQVIATVARGWTRGISSKPFFAMRWEDQLERPLDEIRRELEV